MNSNGGSARRPDWVRRRSEQRSAECGRSWESLRGRREPFRRHGSGVRARCCSRATPPTSHRTDISDVSSQDGHILPCSTSPVSNALVAGVAPHPPAHRSNSGRHGRRPHFSDSSPRLTSESRPNEARSSVAAPISTATALSTPTARARRAVALLAGLMEGTGSAQAWARHAKLVIGNLNAPLQFGEARPPRRAA